ncbi:hypothetical protein KFL_005830060 [Klebsormidium nitens]|uniref:Phage tail collar domain-containing protein n=1 Tax=Klebsormidium nitens TaxID=105231 RepID=A0A1Y1IPC1_KLENI|nr:hypothetical protein KFL_005830060 [Klebsormidium nitens]|eukprot:GAQ89968.1 hypothetical protein KFL_005830060 [Klebsormidium nitens]
MRGRTIEHNGGAGGYALGNTLGSETVSLGVNHFPSHSHGVGLDSPLPPTFTAGQSPANIDTTLPPGQQAVVVPYDDNGPGVSSNGQLYRTALGSVAGGSQPHGNLQPYLVIQCAIATTGFI